MQGRNLQVLYFGDGLRAVIVPAKKYANWDTVYIYEEMETELGQKVRIMPDTNTTNSSNEDDNDEPTKKKLKVDEESNGQTTISQVDVVKISSENYWFKISFRLSYQAYFSLPKSLLIIL